MKSFTQEETIKQCPQCKKTLPVSFFFSKGNICPMCKHPGTIRMENQLLILENKKRCTSCKKVQDTNNFYKNKYIKSGLQPICKTCRAEYVKARYVRAPGVLEKKIARQKLLDKGLKKCSVCDEIKSASQFIEKRWVCKPCRAIKNTRYGKAHYNKNREKILSARKQTKNLPSKSKALFQQLLPIDSPKIDKNGFITIKCYLCGKRFLPKTKAIENRVRAIRMLSRGEHNFYCSKSCKNTCPVYKFLPGIQIDPRSDLYTPKTEAQQARAEQTNELKQKQCREFGHNYCERCGDIIDVELHHTLPIAQYGMNAVDGDSHLLLCAGCHVAMHRDCK